MIALEVEVFRRCHRALNFVTSHPPITPGFLEVSTLIVRHTAPLGSRLLLKLLILKSTVGFELGDFRIDACVQVVKHIIGIILLILVLFHDLLHFFHPTGIAALSGCSFFRKVDICIQRFPVIH